MIGCCIKTEIRKARNCPNFLTILTAPPLVGLPRVEALREKGISYKELEEKGILLPVRNFSIKYIAPAKYDDVIQIKTEISDIKNSQIIFKYSIYLKQKLIATADTELVFVSKENFRPIKAPADFKSLMDNING